MSNVCFFDFMKVLHLNTFQEGGAALCAIRIDKALERQGVESRMLFAQGTSLPEGVNGAIAEKDRIVKLRSNPLFAKFRHLLMRIPWYMNVEKMQVQLNKANAQHLFLHIPYSDYTNIVHHPLVEWADVLHLHWVSDFVDYSTFFKKIKKPIIWTLHDMYPAIGVMHFESDYTVLPSALDGIDALCRRIKRKSVNQTKNLNLVAISDRMNSIIRTSEILKYFPVSRIYNGVDTNIYKPIDVDRKEYFQSIANNTLVFMFSSYAINDKRKGIDRVIDALEKVKHKIRINIAMIAVGRVDANDTPTASFPIHYTGLIGSEDKLSRAYSGADYFINASYEEAFAQTTLEAMACGIPVISTPCSGACDLIRPFNGVVCEDYDSSSLKDGIIKALSMNFDSVKIRHYIIEHYDYSIIAREYIKLYNRILNR